MDLERLRQRLKTLVQTPSDRTELGRLARDVGHSLPSATLQELRELRAASAAAQDDLRQVPGAEFLKGLLFGLTETAVAYEAEIQTVAERDERRRFVGQEVHVGVLRQLEEGSRLPRDLVRELTTSDAQVSRALKDLRAMGLVDLMPPAKLEDQRTRPHRLTSEGRVFLRNLERQHTEVAPSRLRHKMDVEEALANGNPTAQQDAVEVVMAKRSRVARTARFRQRR